MMLAEASGATLSVNDTITMSKSLLRLQIMWQKRKWFDSTCKNTVTQVKNHHRRESATTKHQVQITQ